MATLSKTLDYMFSYIERNYEIDLTIGEKMSLKEILKYVQTICANKPLDDIFGTSQIRQTERIWLLQYGISYEGDYEEETLFESYAENLGYKIRTPEFKKLFNRRRDESFLL